MAIETDTTLDGLVGEHVLDAVDFDTLRVKRWSDEFQNAEVIRFRLDGIVYTAVQDYDDGYRSSMEKIFISDDPMRNVFSPVRVLARKKARSEWRESNDTLELIDLITGKVILEVGTDNYDDYYPSWVASFSPENMAINAPPYPLSGASAAATVAQPKYQDNEDVS